MIHGRSNFSDNKKYNRELSQHSNCLGCARVKARIFVGRLGGNGDDQVMAIGTEFFNTITSTSMPPHRMALKVGVPVILLKNLDATLGLCNGTRLIIWCLAQKLIIAQINSGAHEGNIVNILHITTTTNRSKWPFTLQRH
jgi:hypothetical protein